MRTKRLVDNKDTVTLDVHGMPIGEAVALVQRTVQVAAARGRREVKVIHGRSTSSKQYQNRTIKHELAALLETGRLQPWVQSSWQGEGDTRLALDVTTTPDHRPIQLQEVW